MHLRAVAVEGPLQRPERGALLLQPGRQREREAPARRVQAAAAHGRRDVAAKLLVPQQEGLQPGVREAGGCSRM